VKRLVYFLLLTACVLVLTVPAFAIPNPTVLCQGNVCGGGGLRNYYYDISVLPEEKFTSFGIGIHDPVLANYASIVTPAGWSVTINELDPNKPQWTMPDDPFTAHGLNTGGPSGLCPYTLFWWDPIGTGLQQANFGFDNPNSPHDVGWVVSGIRENWAMPVGTGAGPVHSPVPEPGSLLALGSGLLGLAGTAIRRRR